MQLREQVYLEASINYETKWSQHFSWLVFGKTKDGFPYVKCSICMSYAKGNTRYAMQGDDGGRDLQTQSFRAHKHTDAHKAAVNRQLKLAAGIREGQQAIFDFINSDVEGRRAIRLMRSTQFLCQCDAPISMFPKLMRHLAEQDTPDIPRQSYGVYLTRYLILPLDCSWTYVTCGFFITILTILFSVQIRVPTNGSQHQYIPHSGPDGPHPGIPLPGHSNRQIACEFFTLLTVERCDAGSLFEVLLNHLRSATVVVSKIVGISTDGASVMARLREHVPHLFSCHCIAHREALAVKDAAESNEDLGMVDKVVRTVATLLGNSSVWSQRFKYLQRVIYQTNLEVQGIHTVRWLSRGDAVRRLCKVLGACIVLLWEHNHKAYEIVTCYKFQFCLFFLADILADMNDLNRCFQRREVRLNASIMLRWEV
ncbi:unnamed protein product [Closterium sp. NIES-54]